MEVPAHLVNRGLVSITGPGNPFMDTREIYLGIMLARATRSLSHQMFMDTPRTLGPPKPGPRRVNHEAKAKSRAKRKAGRRRKR